MAIPNIFGPLIGPISTQLLDQNFSYLLGQAPYSGSGGGNAMSFVPTGTGAVSRSLVSKFSEIVSIQDFGASTSNSATANTTAIQLALNSGAAGVYVPAGIYQYVPPLVMPTTIGFVFYGAGTSSQLIQNAGTAGVSGITWPSTGTGTVGYYESYIRDLSFTGTNANADIINTTFVGGLTLKNVFCWNPAATYSFIRINGNPSSSSDKYSHDVRLFNIQCYTNGAGGAAFAGIYWDQFAGDTSCDGFVMNGNGVVQYCAYLANGAQSVNLSNSHPYNAATNILFTASGATTYLGLEFTNVVFDNVLSGTGDNVVLNNANCAIFNSCWFEVVHTGRNAVTLTNCRGTVLANCRADAASASSPNYIVNETGTTDLTTVIGGDSPTLSSFLNPPFNFIGAHSNQQKFISTTPWGMLQTFVGQCTSAVATNSTVYLGPNAAQPGPATAAFMIGLNSGVYVLRADIAWDVAPGVGQSYTFTLQFNGATMVAAAGSANPLVASGAGIFSGSIIIAQGSGSFATQFGQLMIKLVTSNGAATPVVRYSITVQG